MQHHVNLNHIKRCMLFTFLFDESYYKVNSVKLIFLTIVVLLSSSCSSFFSGSDPLPLSTADREIVKNSVIHRGFIPRVAEISKEETTKVYVFAFDGTENNRENFDKGNERQTVVGYLSSKLEDTGVSVDYIVGPGVGSKLDSAICYSCKDKALGALALLEEKITSDTSTNSNISIKIVVLGFSRGAAIGRHFMNLISERWPYDGPNKIRTYGLLFDTVATSVTNELMLGIAPTTDYLVHIIARDERRVMFPVIIDNDLAFKSKNVDNSVITPRLTQLTLPGVHSDIGTSYKFGIGAFYRYLGKVVLADYGLLQRPDIDFNEDFFSQGAHDSRGWFSRILGAMSYLDAPESIRKTITKNSFLISSGRAKNIVLRNESNIPYNSWSSYHYAETHPLVFKVSKVEDDLEIISAHAAFSVVIENLKFEKVDEERCITFNFKGLGGQQKLIIDNKVWNAIPEARPSKIELVPLKRNGHESLFILVNNKRIKKYL